MWYSSKRLYQNLQLSDLDPKNNETVQTPGISLRCPLGWTCPFSLGMEALVKVCGGRLSEINFNKLSSLEQKSLTPPLFTYLLGTYYVREPSPPISVLSPADPHPSPYTAPPSPTFHLWNKNTCCTDSQIPQSRVPRVSSPPGCP